MKPLYAQDIHMENATLQEVLTSLHPVIDNFALSATFVRTSYHPELLENPANESGLEVERTTTSDIVVSSSGMKETLFDVGKTGDLLTRDTIHYATDGVKTTTYDRKANRGVVR